MNKTVRQRDYKMICSGFYPPGNGPKPLKTGKVVGISFKT